MPAVLSLTAQLFRRALGILADGLAHFFVGGDPLSFPVRAVQPASGSGWPS